MRVLALDPGEKIGWARADVSDAGEWTNVRHSITPLREMAIAVHEAMTKFPVRGPGEPLTKYASDYDVVVMEDWRLFPEMAKTFVGSNFPSVQFIGAVKLACWVSGTKLVMYGASTKKHTLAPMAKLNPELHAKCTSTITHDDGHDQDALIHLWRWTHLHYDLITPIKEGV